MGSKDASHKENKNRKKNKRGRNNNLNSNPSTASGGKNGGRGGGGRKVNSDPRFAPLYSDPRFREAPKHISKVEIDSRFQSMFTDEAFSTSSAPVDKRGRQKKSRVEHMRHYYKIKEDEEGIIKEVGEEEESEQSSEEEENNCHSHLMVKSIASESDESEDEDKAGELESSSTDTDDDGEYDIYEGELPELQEENIHEIEKETRRLAVMNLDWRYVKAADIYVVFSSFLPKDGQIKSVAVYPSEFGLERMKEEDIHGPVGLFDDETTESDEDEEALNEKLRQYEKTRLRYYYAVVECDSVATADYLYTNLDGTEFERSSNVLDLRFIPDSMEFKHPPRDVATEAPTDYVGLDFQTRALQQSKIQLSWDEDEPVRAKTLKHKFNDDQLAELELKEYLASEESDNEDFDNDDEKEDEHDKKSKKREMYRALLQSGDFEDADGEDENQEMEVTFNTGLEDLSKKILEKKDKGSETVWEAYLRKRREKKKAKKNKSKHSSDDESSDTDHEVPQQQDDFFIEEPILKRRKGADQDVDREDRATKEELELLLLDDQWADNGVKGYNLKPIKMQMKKGKKGKKVLDEAKIPSIDYDDPRFAALYTSPLFAKDPTHPLFKWSATYARQVAEKQQKAKDRDSIQVENANLSSKIDDTRKDEQEKHDNLPSQKEKYELSALVKSVKMKSKQVQPSECKMTRKGKQHFL